jgi:hypothetical protein
MNIYYNNLDKRLSHLETLLENLEHKTYENNDTPELIHKVDGQWKILKNNLKDYWDETYDTKEEAEKALRTYLKYAKSILNNY